MRRIIIASLFPLAALGFTPDEKPIPKDYWMLRHILNDSLFQGEVYCQAHISVPDLFWPSDLPKEPYPKSYYHEQFIKSGKQLYHLIEGTGRIYQIEQSGDSLRWTRVDASRVTAYNYTAFSFLHQDTIFSIGGYGLWTFNGHLRYYDTNHKGWELRTLNRKINIQNTTLGIFHDYANGMLYFLDRGESDDHLHPELMNAESEKIRGSVFRLDLRNGNWYDLGKAAFDYTWAGRAVKAGNLPFGELIVLGNQPKNGIYVIDHSRNTLLTPSVPGDLKNLYGSVVIANSTAERRIMTYYRDSTLTVLSSNGGIRNFRIRRNDFISTEKVLIQEEVSGYWAWAIGIMMIVAASLIVRRINKRKSEPEQGTEERFSGKELQLLQSLLDADRLTLTPDAVDGILSPEITSRDAINQRRSITLRNINNRFQQLTGSSHELIRKRRLENDRRMIEYWISPDDREVLMNSLGVRPTGDKHDASE